MVVFTPLNLSWNLGINLTYTYEQNVSFQFGTSMMWKKASSIPVDYKPNIIRLSLFSPNPLDHLDNIHFSIGKIFYLNKLESMRLNLSIGAAVTSICEPRDWERNQGMNIGLEDTHNYNHYEYRTISLLITPSVEFPVDNDFGVNITPMYLVNKDRYFFGIKIGLMIGYLK